METKKIQEKPFTKIEAAIMRLSSRVEDVAGGKIQEEIYNILRPTLPRRPKTK